MNFIIGVLLGVAEAFLVMRLYGSKPACSGRPDDYHVEPLPKGNGTAVIYMPESDLDMARERVLEHNKELGIDTPLTDLI
jgi:hypothetical protein